MDVAAHLEGARGGKGFTEILARRLFLGIELAIDIDLMDETVLVGEGQGLAATDGHFCGAKGASLLGDGMASVCSHGQAWEEEKEGEEFTHGSPLTTL
jgi:hypothetical protein